MGIVEMCGVHAGGMIGRERIGDQEAEGGLHDEYLGVGTEENICIWTVCLH
jgi:hypothetical protein